MRKHLMGLWSRTLRRLNPFLLSRTTSPALDKAAELRDAKPIHGQIRIYNKSPVFLFVVTTAIIFLTEFGVMTLFLPLVPVHFQWLHDVVDATSLTLLLLPVVYFFWFRPMRGHITQLVNKDLLLEIEISERKSTEQALLESESQLRFLSSRLLTAQETERRRVSREIHDEVGAALALLKLRMGLIEKQLKKSQINLKEECNQNLQYIDQVIENVSRLSRDLSPSILEDLGFTAAFRWLANNFMKNYHVKVMLNITEIDRLFPRHEQIILYRIFQEAFNNIGKHAQAKTVSVTAERRNGHLTFLVEDDGKGFDLRKAAARGPSEKGLGLMIMDERARMLRGSIEVQSQEGEGTRISLTIPVGE